jgi:hypothetical protein
MPLTAKLKRGNIRYVCSPKFSLGVKLFPQLEFSYAD